MAELKTVCILACVVMVMCMIVPAATFGKCTISADWIDLSMEERLLNSDVVVYGRTKEHRSKRITVDGRATFSINAVFEVYCVLKRADEPVPETITIEAIAPRNGCSGTKQYMQIDNEAIVSLKASYGGMYQYDEVMPLLSATFEATRENLFTVSNLCDLQEWAAPDGATVNRCPICSVANFSDTLLAKEPQTAQIPCFGADGSLNGDGTDCSLIANFLPSNTSTCIPDDYSRTCTRVLHTPPSATCTCMSIPARDNGDDFSEIGGVSAALPCMMTTIFMAVLAAIGS